MTDLLLEFSHYAARTGTRWDEALIHRYRVPRDWLQALTAPARYGVARARLDRDGSWVPTAEGTTVLVLPACPLAALDDPIWPSADVGDLVAFDPRDPERWWTRLGCPLLNEEAQARAALCREPLVVHPTPLAWMQAAGAGVVVLDWSRPLSVWMAGPPSLIAPTLDLAERLDRALNRPPPRARIELPAHVIKRNVA
ncbi:hypothetical protein [Pararhodospirillum oryzae]|uniref:Uncharacterized protein n=1 Tax=Pararhodospirillum oryzae TaxID=478448 RepID=A0A512H922_9PROT|nr:hypothetical protein [Pararhodospirillum oryzae]GEO81956.1 hypothetical protein ROR02_20870 [Pararhodospirillum oryzae]